MLRLFHPVWFLFPRMKNVMSSVACLICVCSAVSCFEIAWIYEYHNLAWDIQCMLNVGTYVIIIPVYLSRCWEITKKDLPDKQRKKKKTTTTLAVEGKATIIQQFLKWIAHPFLIMFTEIGYKLLYLVLFFLCKSKKHAHIRKSETNPKWMQTPQSNTVNFFFQKGKYLFLCSYLLNTLLPIDVYDLLEFHPIICPCGTEGSFEMG